MPVELASVLGVSVAFGFGSYRCAAMASASFSCSNGLMSVGLSDARGGGTYENDKKRSRATFSKQTAGYSPDARSANRSATRMAAF